MARVARLARVDLLKTDKTDVVASGCLQFAAEACTGIATEHRIPGVKSLNSEQIPRRPGRTADLTITARVGRQSHDDRVPPGQHRRRHRVPAAGTDAPRPGADGDPNWIWPLQPAAGQQVRERFVYSQRLPASAKALTVLQDAGVVYRFPRDIDGS
jgi:hypothetical protein